MAFIMFLHCEITIKSKKKKPKNTYGSGTLTPYKIIRKECETKEKEICPLKA